MHTCSFCKPPSFNTKAEAAAAPHSSSAPLGDAADDDGEGNRAAPELLAATPLRQTGHSRDKQSTPSLFSPPSTVRAAQNGRRRSGPASAQRGGDRPVMSPLALSPAWNNCQPDPVAAQAAESESMGWSDRPTVKVGDVGDDNVLYTAPLVSHRHASAARFWSGGDPRCTLRMALRNLRCNIKGEHIVC